jgi:hypothetical protein
MLRVRQNDGSDAFLKQSFLVVYLIHKTLRPPPQTGAVNTDPSLQVIHRPFSQVTRFTEIMEAIQDVAQEQYNSQDSISRQ